LKAEAKSWHPLCEHLNRGCSTNTAAANIELNAYEYFNYIRDTGRIYHTASSKFNNANAARTTGGNAASHNLA
jgi:hypothetical protein